MNDGYHSNLTYNDQNKTSTGLNVMMKDDGVRHEYLDPGAGVQHDVLDGTLDVLCP